MRLVTVVRRILFATFSILLVALVWIWWNRPQEADLAGYAPASSLVYLECNSLMEVADAIVVTDNWNKVKSFVAGGTGNRTSPRTRRFIALTGIGPTPGVILARAQVAMVMLDLGAREEGNTITLKPEAALLIETHTSEARIKNTVEDALKKFAERSYGKPTLKRIDINGDEFLNWTSPENNRQIVATIDGSLVIVANSDRAVSACLEARRGQRPSLRSDPELQQMRATLSANAALAFGFVSSSHTAELLSLGAPVLFGRAPGEAQFDKLIANSAPKILGSAGWSARSVSGAIEDHYLFSLQAPVVSAMRPLFQPSSAHSDLTLVPADVHSLTVYRFPDPAQTWRGLLTTLSSRLDTLSAILMVSVLKSALLPYGINDPEKFLQFTGPEIMTARLKADSSGSILIAKVRDETQLRELLKNSTTVPDNDGSERRLTVHFQNGYVLMGAEEDVQRCSEAAKAQSSDAKLSYFGSSDPISANIMTYSKDTSRIRNFIAGLVRAQGKSTVSDPTKWEQTIGQFPYAMTQTSLGETGLDRKTRSAFGQFSALVPLLFPEN